MDNLYLDTYFFFVPNRLVWSHWKEFCGENTGSAWVPQVEYQIPSISAPSGGFASGTIADYMGLPIGVDWDNNASRRPSALPFRALALIANEFFRDENLTDPLNISFGDSNQTGSNGSNYVNDVANGGMPFKVAKYHDYFTSALPSPQKNSTPVTIPVVNADLAPVSPRTTHILSVGDSRPLNWDPSGINAGHFDSDGKWANFSASANLAINNPGSTGNFVKSSSASTGSLGDAVFFNNLYADLSSTIGAVSINELRLAFQLQRFYERLARGGSRYTEFLQSFFSVRSPDATLQRPEYLGGNRVPINIHEVLNNAQSSGEFLGDLGAYSVTHDINQDFVHSFTEHGLVIGCLCARYDHSYGQGLERFWSRRKFTDFYLPTFSSLGEMPIYKSEIYADATTMTDDSVFGYNEAWADYRFKPDRISGEMRPGIANTLASWHFSDYYQSAPTLSDSWIREDKTNVDRTLAVTSANANQIFADIYIKNICTRVMPMYSIPGLIDHH